MAPFHILKMFVWEKKLEKHFSQQTQLKKYFSVLLSLLSVVYLNSFNVTVTLNVG